MAFLMVLWFCCYEGSRWKVRLTCSKGTEEEIVWRAFTIFMLSGKMVILIGWKYVMTIMVKLIYTPNKNMKFFLLHVYLYMHIIFTKFSFFLNNKVKYLSNTAKIITDKLFQTVFFKHCINFISELLTSSEKNDNFIS